MSISFAIFFLFHFIEIEETYALKRVFLVYVFVCVYFSLASSTFRDRFILHGLLLLISRLCLGIFAVVLFRRTISISFTGVTVYHKD